MGSPANGARGIQSRRRLVEIKVLTDGSGAGTIISINGVVLEKVGEFNLGLFANKNVKIQGVRYNDKIGVWEPFSFYGADFEKLTMDRQTEPPPTSFVGSKVPREDAAITTPGVAAAPAQSVAGN